MPMNETATFLGDLPKKSILSNLYCRVIINAPNHTFAENLNSIHPQMFRSQKFASRFKQKAGKF
jgi:hypothetical protein